MRALVLALALACPQAVLAQSDRPGLQLSGDAHMGLRWSNRTDALGPVEKGLRMSSRARLHFQFMGETDGGLRYGVNLGRDVQNNRTTGRSIFIER